MISAVTLVRALSRLGPKAIEMRNDADELELCAVGVSLADPTLHAVKTPAEEALRAAIVEALTPTVSFVELTVRTSEGGARVRWRSAAQDAGEISPLGPPAEGQLVPSVRVHVRERFSLEVLADAIKRRRPETDALRAAAFDPWVPLQLGDEVVPRTRRPALATVALSSLPPTLRGEIDLMAGGFAPEVVRCVQGWVWSVEPLWPETSLRPPVRVWIDASSPEEHEQHPAWRKVSLRAEWTKLAAASASLEAARSSLYEVLAAGVLREGRLQLQDGGSGALVKAPFRATAIEDAETDPWLPSPGALGPLVEAPLFLVTGGGRWELSLRQLATHLTAPAEALRYQDEGVGPAPQPRLLRVDNSAFAALVAALPWGGEEGLLNYPALARLQAKAQGPTPAAREVRPPRVRIEVPAGVLDDGRVALQGAHADADQPIAFARLEGSTPVPSRPLGPPCKAHNKTHRFAWTLMADRRFVPEDAPRTHLARPCLALADALTGTSAVSAQLNQCLVTSRLEDQIALQRGLASHFAGISLGLDPRSVFGLEPRRLTRSSDPLHGVLLCSSSDRQTHGALDPSDDGPSPSRSRRRVWFRWRDTGRYLGLNDADHLWRTDQSAAAVLEVALGTLRAEGVPGSQEVSDDEAWAVIVRSQGDLRVRSLRAWAFDGWAVVADDGASPWEESLAQHLVQACSQRLEVLGNRAGREPVGTHVESDGETVLALIDLWLHLIALGAFTRSEARASVLAEMERVPFLRVTDAKDQRRAVSVEALRQQQRAGTPLTAWWWRDLLPAEAWGGPAGLSLPDTPQARAVLAALAERCGVTLARGEPRPAADGADIAPVQPREVRRGNLRAYLRLAASPSLAVLGAPSRDQVFALLVRHCSSLGDVLPEMRAARVLRTRDGGFVARDDFPEGRRPGVDIVASGRPNANGSAGEQPTLQLTVYAETIYRGETDADGEVSSARYLQLGFAGEAELLNQLFAPLRVLEVTEAIVPFDD